MEQAFVTDWEGADKAEVTDTDVTGLFDSQPPGCPWCGQWETLTLAVYPVLEGPLFAIMCTGCGAVGPEAQSKPEAAATWATRGGVINKENLMDTLQAMKRALKEEGADNDG